jgi:hypothetical protein
MVISLFLLGCTTTRLNVNIQSHPNTGKDLKNYKTFMIFQRSEENPDLEVDLLKIVNAELQEKGYIYKEKNPDFAVLIAFSNSRIKSRTKTKPEYKIVDSNVYNSCSDARVSNLSVNIRKAHIGDTIVPASLTESGKGYFTHIQLYFIDTRKLREQKKMELLWKGHVLNNGSNGEMRKLAPHFIKELLREFPLKSGKKNQRVVKIS